MDIMDLLAQARPGSLDPRPGTDRRASDLARALATPRAGVTAQPGADRRLGVRRALPPARVVAIGTSVAALAGIAGVVVALTATGMPAARPQPAAARAGTAVPPPGELKNAILTALNSTDGDIGYTVMTETCPGDKDGCDSLQKDWNYPIQPQAGQEVHVRSLFLTPSNTSDTQYTYADDTQYTYTEPSAAKAGLPTRTDIIFVEYGSRTWSDTTAQVAFTGGTMKENFQEFLATGGFTTQKTTLNGQTMLELTEHSTNEGEEIWWVDPTTDLPVQTYSQGVGMNGEPGLVKMQTDCGFLPPTPVNMAELKAVIPPGFTQTPTIQK
jgi:hypothetical protein